MGVALSLYVDCHKQLPYMEGISGWEMLARFGGAKNDWGLNCNHGAPRSGIGGWQGVNLPPNKWRILMEKWEQDEVPGGIPLFWCGKPNPIWGRVSWCAYPGDEPCITLGDYGDDTLEAAVAKLNKYLVEMGEEPIPMDVPEGIDWRQYETKNRP
jgi:hypothetical protein